MNETMQLILQTLPDYGLSLGHYQDRKIQLQGNYTIEIENPKLFKLLWNNQVIAPFDDLAEMLTFIQMDMQLNGEN